MLDLIELQRKIQENRGETRPSKVRSRTAVVDDASKLLKSGSFSPEEISYFQGLPLSVVRAEQARLEERDRAKQRYLSSLKMELPGQLAHFTIYQR